jgi:stage III sporulation protein AE
VLDDYDGGDSMNMEELTTQFASGEMSFSTSEILSYGVQSFFAATYQNMYLMLELLILIIATAFITNLQKSFDSKGSGEVAFFACYIVIVGLAVKGFMTVAQVGQAFVDTASAFMERFVPILVLLIASSGGIASAAAFHPVLMVMTEILTVFIKDIIIPVLFIATALGIISNLSDRFRVDKIVKMMHNFIAWSMGILLTVFVGIISIQSMAMPAIDGITAKTAKYAVGSFVPVVGKVLSDTVDVVMGCSVILKNSFGVAGIVAMCGMCFAPAVQILANSVIYSITAAVAQPVADKRIVGCISHLGKSMTYMFAIILCLALILIITSAIVIKAGGKQ